MTERPSAFRFAIMGRTDGAAQLACRIVAVIVIIQAAGWPRLGLSAEEPMDVVAYFQRIASTRGAGLARKSKPVDVRPATPGEVIVTIIKGEGQETQSPPAKPGDMVVRNRCPETGNEQILVSAATFPQRYEGPIGAKAADGWQPYRPRGVPMRFVIVAAEDGTFRFTAPWGESMVARPGDVIVQDPDNPKDTYRIAKAAFACTYDVLREPQR